MNSRLKSTLKYLLFMAIGGFLFYLAFRNTEFKKLASDFESANYGYIIASMVMGFLAFVSRGMRWVLLLEPLGKKPHTWHSIHSISIGYLSNLLVPRAGELARCTALKGSDQIPVNRLFGTVIVERIIDFIMLGLLVALTFILKFDSS
ncbi:MAG: lysylphosphatidylglycerol synthase transmembrane domain-containing protein [Owenweeksia sp.]|nr:lysylphosphatidylglycerol synthase transmembrane domain-containing protein [Owenweeksia sp.]